MYLVTIILFFVSSEIAFAKTGKLGFMVFSQLFVYLASIIFMPFIFGVSTPEAIIKFSGLFGFILIAGPIGKLSIGRPIAFFVVQGLIFLFAVFVFKDLVGVLEF